MFEAAPKVRKNRIKCSKPTAYSKFSDLSTARHRKFDYARVSTLLLELERRGAAFLDRAGFPPARRRFEFAFQGRYLYQSWDIEVHFEFQGTELGKDNLYRLKKAFHQTHERIYTIKDDAEII